MGGSGCCVRLLLADDGRGPVCVLPIEIAFKPTTAVTRATTTERFLSLALSLSIFHSFRSTEPLSFYYSLSLVSPLSATNIYYSFGQTCIHPVFVGIPSPIVVC
jgi:hypothetical protein